MPPPMFVKLVKPVCNRKEDKYERKNGYHIGCACSRGFALPEKTTWCESGLEETLQIKGARFAQHFRRTLDSHRVPSPFIRTILPAPPPWQPHRCSMWPLRIQRTFGIRLRPIAHTLSTLDQLIGPASFLQSHRRRRQFIQFPAQHRESTGQRDDEKQQTEIQPQPTVPCKQERLRLRR